MGSILRGNRLNIKEGIGSILRGGNWLDIKE
jgi:hypothetical protein